MKLMRYMFVFIEFVILSLLFITIERIVADKRLADYINPDYHVFVYSSLVILIIFAAFAMFISSGRNLNEAPPGTAKYLVFIILIILMNLPHDSSLFYQHIQNERDFNFTADAGDKAGKKKISEISELDHDISLPGEAPGGNSSKADIFKIGSENFYAASEDINRNSGKYINAKIDVRGFVYKSKKLRKDRYILARLVMYCCAADAGITGVLFNAESTGVSFKKDEWLELYGHIEMQSAGSDGKDEKAPVLVVESYKRIPAEPSPYVYPVN